MRIRKMDATFGKLRRSSLELGDGLNIIYGDNESGKSTWCGFIRAMLYGINTREQSKIGFIADKEKYRPYSGESMHGRMEVQWQDKELIIERTAGRSGIFGAPVVTDSVTGIAVNGIDVPGENMLGIKKEVFERSAFIGQTILKVENDKSGELERRIVSMASSGQEESSFSQAEQRLKGWKNRRRYHNRGLAPELEEKILNVKNTLNSLRGDAAALTVKQGKIKSLTELHADYSRQAEVWRGLRAWEKMNFSEDAKQQMEKAEAALKQAIDEAKFGDLLPNEEYCDNINKLYQQYVNAQKEYTARIEEVRKCEIEFSEEQKKLNAFASFANVENRSAEQDEKRALELTEKIKKKTFAIPFVLGVLAGIILGVGAYFVCSTLNLLPQGIPDWAPGAGLCAAGIIFGACVGLYRKKKKAALNKELCELLSLYGVEEAEQIRVKDEEYNFQKNAVEACAAKALQAQADLDKADSEREKSRAELKHVTQELDSDADEADAPALIEKMRANISRVKEAHAILKTAAVRFETVKKGQNLDAFLQDARACAPGTEKPEYSEEELSMKLGEINAQLRELELDCSASQARINHVGNQGDLQEQLRQANEKLREINADTRALEYALEELSNANGEMQRRFAPDLEKKAGEIFEKLTEGHFKIVEILNPQMEMAVREESAAQARQVLELSAGTADELYLSMRLALSDMLTSGEEIPLVMDDALVNFDDSRMEKTLEYLAELAEKRQVILFSCQKREALWAEKYPRVQVQRI